ncbi:MAG: flagellar hook-basal body complex protein [Chlamydiales bacterium]|nr:flagellar hook-basal body complex protein [Chlamydiales bacterium]
MSFRGLMTGVSGLKSQSYKMEVVGNNLANVNTAGFKKSNVTFHESFSEIIKNASGGDGNNLKGTNPMSIGSGVSIGSVDKVFSQGARVQTSRTLDFMIEGNDFFVAENGTNGALMLTRNGNFQLDGTSTLVDTLGNKVLGFNVDRETGEVDSIAGAIEIPSGSIKPNATTEMYYEANLDSSIIEENIGSKTNAWEVFSGGENFGQMDIAIVGEGASRDEYGSGYYKESLLVRDSASVFNVASPTQFTLSDADYPDGFAVDDVVSILQGSTQVRATVTNVAGTTITVDSDLSTDGFTTGTFEVTNLSQTEAARGTSSNGFKQDVLKSQIAVVDDSGNLLASFYRVSGPPAEYTRATATLDDSSEITIGIGEFSNMKELRDLFERTLRDSDLTNKGTLSSNLIVRLDKFGGITFAGSGMVEDFMLVINEENTEMRDRFEGMVVTTNPENTQAVLDANFEITSAPSVTDTRTKDASKDWFDADGLENYGYSSSIQTTEYGEYAGLRLDGGSSGAGFGVVRLSHVNALGETKVTDFKLVPRDAKRSFGEFATMGELAKLVELKLKEADFSSVADGGTLLADETVSAGVVDGRLVVTTASGSFRDLKLNAVNNTTDDASWGIDRSDEQNFDTVLGELSDGVNGKAGTSNKFIAPDATIRTRVFDSQGNEHTVDTFLVRDRSAGLTNIEWKFKNTLNPNLNTFASDNPDLASVYNTTYNSIEDSTGSRGVIAFDIDSGIVLSSTHDGRYTDNGDLTFLPAYSSQEAKQMEIEIDFSRLTSYNGKNTAIGHNQDGFAMGELSRLSTEDVNGHILGIYSNGQIRTLAKIGLMHIGNPGGLEKVGSSYYIQTNNSDGDAAIKGLDQVYSVSNKNVDTVKSKIFGNALEASNVNLTEDLTEIIITQRAYSASGKIISVSDEMLREALGLRR